MTTLRRGFGFDLLKLERLHIRSALARFDNFWKTQGKIAPIEVICSWIVKSAPLMDRFLFIQQQIHSYLEEGSEEEKSHISSTKEFQDLYFKLMHETQTYISDYSFQRHSRN